MSFLDQIVRWIRRGPIVIITDNISTRTGAAAKDWLARHSRVRFVFTPKHGSWLNQVEIWFGIVTVIAVEIGLLTPPFGMAVFVIKSTLGKDSPITLQHIFAGALPFAIIMVIVLLAVIAFPSLATLLF